MRKTSLPFLIATFLVGPCTALCAAPAQPVTPAQAATSTAPSDTAIAGWLQQLSDQDFAVREAADKKLREADWKAMSSMVIARGVVTDPESTTRIRSIIEESCWSTKNLAQEDAKVVDALREATGPGSPNRDRASMGLKASATANLVVARAFSILQPGGFVNASERSVELDLLLAELKRRQSWDELEWSLFGLGSFRELAAVAQEHGDSQQFLLAANALKNSQPMDSRASDTLGDLEVCMSLAAADQEKALKVARTLGDRRSVIRILAERQDWNALADYVNPQIDRGGTYARAAALQYLGRITDADKAMALPIRPEHYELLSLSNQSLLLGRTELAFSRVRDNIGEEDAVEVLLVQRRYAQAYAFYRDSKTKKDLQGVDYEYQFLPALIRLNERDRATAIIQNYVTSGDASKSYTVAFSHINAADDLLGNFDAVAERVPDSDIVSIMSRRWLECMTWAEALKADGAGVKESLKAIDKILNDQMPADELRRISDKAVAGNDRKDWNMRRSSVLIYAALHLERLGMHQAAGTYVDQYLNITPVLPEPSSAWPDAAHPFVDVLSLGNWKLSERLLDGAASRTMPDPVYSYLDGLAHAKLGEQEPGRKLIAEAEFRMGGDLPRRLFLAQTLARLGEQDAAAAQAQVVLDLEVPISLTRNDAHQLLAEIERDRGNFSKALQHVRLGTLNLFLQCAIKTSDCIPIARNAAYCEARIALAQNAPAAALKSATEILTLDPEDLELTLKIIAAFKQAHLDDQAKSLAGINRTLLENILQDFPNSHLHHFLIAKLDLQSGFTNEQTQAHLAKARQLAPANTEYQALK